jgi:hypothetical protein
LPLFAFYIPSILKRGENAADPSHYSNILCQTKTMLGNHSGYDPTFTVFTEYVSGVPHLVTVRPAAIPKSKVTELSTAIEIAGVLKREVHRVVKLYKPSWAGIYYY